MNTTASFSSDHSWSRRCSTETVFSIQGQETDFVRDTSDTDACGSDGERDVEYEPVTDTEGQGVSEDSSESENEIITTKVIEVSVNDDGELQFADSEQTESEGSDSEMDLHDYWKCAQCRTRNNNPLYRYCEACFKVRKNFFPPRPKRKKRRDSRLSDIPRTLSQDSGVESQELSQGHNSETMSIVTMVSHQSSSETVFSSSETVISSSHTVTSNLETAISNSDITISKTENVFSKTETVSNLNLELINKSEVKSEQGLDQSERSCDQSGRTNLEVSNQSDCQPETFQNSQVNQANVDRLTIKRRAESADRNSKRTKTVYSDSNSDSDSSRNDDASDIQPLAKTISDPSITVEDSINITKKVISSTLKGAVDGDLCIICCTEPKSGVFVHGRVAHICCCYKCAVKVWQKAKRCPVCNSKVSNVLKAVVM